MPSCISILILFPGKLLVDCGYAVLGADKESMDDNEYKGGEDEEFEDVSDFEETEENKDDDGAEEFLTETCDNFIKEIMSHEVTDEVESEENILQVDGVNDSSDEEYDCEVDRWGGSSKEKHRKDLKDDKEIRKKVREQGELKRKRAADMVSDDESSGDEVPVKRRKGRKSVVIQSSDSETENQEGTVEKVKEPAENEREKAEKEKKNI